MVPRPLRASGTGCFRSPEILSGHVAQGKGRCATRARTECPGYVESRQSLQRPLHPHLPIKRAVLDGFLNMFDADLVTGCQVCNGS